MDEHEPAPRVDTHGVEGDRHLIVGRRDLHERGAAQRAVEPVGPRVVRAADECAERAARRAFARVDELRPAVAAHVVERAELAVLTPDDEHRLTGDVDAQEVAGRGDVGFPADGHPLSSEDALPFGLPGPLVDVGGAGKGRDERAAHRSPTAVGRPAAHGRGERVRGRRGSHDPTLLSGAPCARVSERANERDRRVDHDDRRRPAGGDAVPAGRRRAVRGAPGGVAVPQGRPHGVVPRLLRPVRRRGRIRGLPSRPARHRIVGRDGDRRVPRRRTRRPAGRDRVARRRSRGRADGSGCSARRTPGSTRCTWRPRVCRSSARSSRCTPPTTATPTTSTTTAACCGRSTSSTTCCTWWR